MRIEDVTSKWGSIVYGSYKEVVDKGQAYWRELGYERDLIIFRGLGQLNLPQQYRLIEYFGKPWTAHEYAYSREVPLEFVYDGKQCAISAFSNLISKRLGDREMPWHVDIPNHGDRSFPWRSLYMVNNPNPDAGLTDFANLRLNAVVQQQADLELFKRMEVLNQSWYREGEEIVRQPFIKTNPISGVESIRANFFVDSRRPDITKQAWIKETFIDGEIVDNYLTLGPIYKRITSIPGNVYTHRWETFDLIIYDNCNLMHRRSHCRLEEGQERKFFRANISHQHK